MELTGLAIIYLIMAISASLYLAASMYLKLERHRQAAKRQYREHIDHLAADLFPASPPTQTSTHTSPSDVQEATVQYQEAKRKMVANIRTYFNQHKINAAIRDTEIAIRETEIKTGLTLHSPMFSSRPDISPPSL